MATVQKWDQATRLEQHKELLVDKLYRLFSRIKYSDASYKLSSIPTGTTIWNITFLKSD
ncbi:hypothetical protein [Methylophaga sp.]|uniref:hypothetical protein n=1 Tax=Methylophaga sp. TaxID=2024840 RepID=UPI00271CADA4|nr:hypothetical protein [Methylophaga sp.]MDO8828067.1 hypothetical protein [Methylophaga sp.]